MSRHFFEFFRCPEDAVRFDIAGGLSSAPDYFRLDEERRRHGKNAAIPVAKHAADLVDTLPAVCVKGDEISLPFDPDQMADYLRCERYIEGSSKGTSRLGTHPLIRDIYYLCRPLLGVPIRSILQRIHLRSQIENPFPKWPVDRTVDRQLSFSRMTLSTKSVKLSAHHSWILTMSTDSRPLSKLCLKVVIRLSLIFFKLFGIVTLKSVCMI